jgi:hypothetical protein
MFFPVVEAGHSPKCRLIKRALLENEARRYVVISTYKQENTRVFEDDALGIFPCFSYD